MVLTSFTQSLALTILMCVFSYMIGSIPNGLWIGKKFKGIDIREHGSKNIGTTNSIRILGKKLGYFVFLLDLIKGMLAIFLVRFILEPFGLMDSKVPYIVYGLCAIFGHAFSVFLKFHGGKSVAASLGVVIMLTPLPAAICILVFAFVFFTTGYVCLCSTFAALSVVIASWILNYTGLHSGWLLERPGIIVCIVYSFVALFLIYKHKSNFKRLANGTENCFKKKKEKNPEN